MLLLPRLSQVNSNRSVDICSELKFYFLLDCWDVWELGLKLVFRGLDPPLVFLTCVFSLVLWILVVCIMFMFRKYSWFMQEIVLCNIHSIHAFFLSGVELPYLLQRESQRLSNFFNRPVHFFTTRTFFVVVVLRKQWTVCVSQSNLIVRSPLVSDHLSKTPKYF